LGVVLLVSGWMPQTIAPERLGLLGVCGAIAVVAGSMFASLAARPAASSVATPVAAPAARSASKPAA
jgi:hypothetical protein